MMDSDSIEITLKEIESTYMCRSVQIRQLFHYLNLPDTRNIVVYGPRSTCKTSICRELIQKFDLFHGWIDIIQHTCNRSMFESILIQLHQTFKTHSEDNELELNQNVKCTNAVVFVEKLEYVLKHFTQEL